jgi:hypothetical protein
MEIIITIDKIIINIFLFIILISQDHKVIYYYSLKNNTVAIITQKIIASTNIINTNISY